MVVAMAIGSLGSSAPAPLRQRLRDALGPAIKGRDRVAVGALRSALAAIENAEAVDRDPSADRGLGIGQIPVGVGAAEVARRELTELDVVRIVRNEVSEREAAARGHELADRLSHAEQLRREIDVLSAYLDDSEAA
jgi:uncharacterized protein